MPHRDRLNEGPTSVWIPTEQRRAFNETAVAADFLNTNNRDGFRRGLVHSGSAGEIVCW